MSKTKTKCDNPLCGKEFLKENKEINRSKRLGRKQYCCLSCYGNAAGKDNFKYVAKENVKQNQDRIREYCGNQRDEYTPFRFYTHVIRNRKNKECNIDNGYLKNLWDEQKGICPYTGWNLILPDNVGGWKKGLTMYSASLDRIDNSKGYIKGNVKFVSVMFNFARNKFTYDDVMVFCEAVINNNLN